MNPRISQENSKVGDKESKVEKTRYPRLPGAGGWESRVEKKHHPLLPEAKRP